MHIKSNVVRINVRDVLLETILNAVNAWQILQKLYDRNAT